MIGILHLEKRSQVFASIEHTHTHTHTHTLTHTRTHTLYLSPTFPLPLFLSDSLLSLINTNTLPMYLPPLFITHTNAFSLSLSLSLYLSITISLAYIHLFSPFSHTRKYTHSLFLLGILKPCKFVFSLSHMNQKIRKKIISTPKFCQHTCFRQTLKFLLLEYKETQ